MAPIMNQYYVGTGDFKSINFDTASGSTTFKEEKEKEKKRIEKFKMFQQPIKPINLRPKEAFRFIPNQKERIYHPRNAI